MKKPQNIVPEHDETDQTCFDRDHRDVLDQLGVQPDHGLADDEVRSRRRRYGANQLQEEQRRSAWLILAGQFKSIVILVLVIAGAFAFATGRLPEGIALAAVTAVNTAIGFFTELKALRSMEALRQLGERSAQVRRGGERLEIAAEQLVPGDIVLLDSEDLVPADLRLVEADGLRVNEAALTGESATVGKSTEPVDSDTPLHERSSMLYKGTNISEGRALGVVTATGMHTELGRISKLTAGAEQQATPLQKQLDRLGRRLAWVTLSVAVLVGAAGLAAGRDAVVMIETAIALGIAAIPEGLPIVATIALARGMWLMARRNALVNRLTAVETLGATSIIFTDKTGTLTENKMELVRALVSEQTYTFSGAGESDEQQAARETDAEQTDLDDTPLLRRLLQVCVLCSNAEADDSAEPSFRGDPTEVALLEAAVGRGLDRRRLLDRMTEIKEVPFDSEVMMMATFHELPKTHESDAGCYVAVKGAPLAVLEASERVWADTGPIELGDELRRTWRERADGLAGEGMRLLALADKEAAGSDEEAFSKLRFIGLVGLEDPPRADVRTAIQDCQDAGIQVLMVTGDRPDTGRSIGEQVGLADEVDAMHGSDLEEPEKLSTKRQDKVASTHVFARVTPEQKLNLVKFYQQQGQIVAMTGDGVNDTPALKQADIGVAMGRRGTDAAKQVADMVLRDDNFATIVAAVREGRIIYANIRKSVLFMLCTNIAEVLAVMCASLAQIPIPLRPLQILYLNVLTDVFPALALGVGVGGGAVMRRRPRGPEEAVLTGHHWRAIALWSFIIGGIVLAALACALFLFGFDEKRAVTVSFLTLAFAKLWFVLNLRDLGTPLWNNDVVRNPWIWTSWALCGCLLLLAVYWAPLAGLLQTAPPGVRGWGLILVLSLVPAALGILLPGIHFYSERGTSPEQGDA